MNTLPEAPPGSASIELEALDLRYEGCRMKQAAREEKLLGAIAERGIEEALEGVDVAGRPVLLNGFKRYRCARKLRLAAVPYVTLGSDAATGIIAMLRASNRRALSILEQAAFLDELKRACNCSVAQIAGDLGRSKGWVSMRLGLFSQMSEGVRRKLFAGVFPVYAYMYTLRPFMRMNGGAEQVERFVGAVSGHGCSVREIELLAQGYFRGPEAVRRHIEQGRVPAVLEELRPAPPGAREGCGPFEAALLGELEAVQKHMVRVSGRSEDQRLQSGAFHAQAHLLAAGILSREPAFVAALRRLHDRGRPA
jgi:hypothetical protein